MKQISVYSILTAVLFCAVSFRSSAQTQEVPRWAKDAVWYQIFPERFRNGDRTNDPTVHDLKGSWPHDQQGDWNISSWTGDWYQLQPWEQSNGKGFYYNAQLRRYGGDLQGIIDRLDYLQDLGVNALYLNPLFESPSLHKYDAAFYHHIDNNFGPDPSRDTQIWNSEQPEDPATWKWTSADSLFLRLVKECHSRKIRVIIDGVFNHVGFNFWALKDVRKNGPASRFADWFTVKKYDDTSTAADEFEYEGWYGIKELPELKEEPNGFSPIVKHHLYAVVKRWMDPNGDGDPSDGIDGWRLDVASMVRIDFWKEFRRWTRAINPESYIVGEVWWEDWAQNKMYDPAPWIADGSVFDAVMNYRAMMPILDLCANRTKRITPSQFMERYRALQQQFRPDVTAVQMNTIDSHDTDRLPSIIVNPDRDFDHIASASDNRSYDVRKPTADEKTVQKMILVLQFVTTGAPSIYYGSEAGMWGGDDPDERKPMVWKEMQFAPERSHPFGASRPADSVAFDDDLFRFYRSLIAMRAAYPALRTGKFTAVSADDDHGTLMFSKMTPDDTVLVCVNVSDNVRKVSAPSIWSKGVKLTDAAGSASPQVKNGKVSVTLAPRSAAVIGRKR